MTFLSSSIAVVAMRKVNIPSFERKMTVKELLSGIKFLI